MTNFKAYAERIRDEYAFYVMIFVVYIHTGQAENIHGYGRNYI